MARVKQKIGGGDYYDGMVYYPGSSEGDPVDNGLSSFLRIRRPTITKAEYEKLLGEYEKRKALEADFAKEKRPTTSQYDFESGSAISVPAAISKAEADALVAKYGKEAVQEVVSEPDWRGRTTTSYYIKNVDAFVGAAPSKEKSGMLAQTEVPEYELDFAPRPDASTQLKRQGADRRMLSKTQEAERYGRNAVINSNEAKKAHVAAAQSANAKIGVPGASYHTGTGINQMIQIAQHNADLGSKGGAKRAQYWSNQANAAANNIQAEMDAEGQRIQGMSDKAQVNADRSNRLVGIVQHLAKRQESAAPVQEMQQGLINSSQSQLNPSAMSGNSIEDMLKK